MLTKMSVTALVFQKAVLIPRPLCVPNSCTRVTLYSGLVVCYTEASDKAAININAFRLISCFTSMLNKGAQWLSGRVLDLRPRGRRFEPHQCHCVVVLERDTFILA